MTQATEMMDAEAVIKRNPHPDFKKVEASRPDWNTDKSFTYTKTADPEWRPGQGANALYTDEDKQKAQIEIDPYGEGRQPANNYKLLISAIVPRPVGFCSTVSKTGADGTRQENLAPFSYFNMINHDPPLFIFGFAGGFSQAKDTLRNLQETGECTVNIISEHFIEAANATSIDAPPGVSEWAISGLTQAKCTVVQTPRVKEAIFAVECKLTSLQEFESKQTPGKKTGVLAVVEGVRFWVREDAIDETRTLIDPKVFRPMSRLGGITYGRVVEGIEIPRPRFSEEKEKGRLDGLIDQNSQL